MLEAELGVKLFSRERKRIALTDSGRAFLDEAKKILAQAENAVEVAQAVGRGEYGVIRLGFSRFVGLQFLPRFMRTFAGRHPGVHVILRQGSVRDMIADLEGRAIDVAILRIPVQSLLLDIQVLRKDPLVAVLPADHPKAKGRAVELGALRDDSFVIPSRRYAGAYSTVTVAACQSVGFSPKQVEEVDGLEAVFCIVAAGRGVALIPKSQSAFATADVKIAELSDCEMAADQIVAWRKDDPSYLRKLLVNTLLEVCA